MVYGRYLFQTSLQKLDWLLFSKATYSDRVLTAAFDEAGEKNGFVRSGRLEGGGEEHPSTSAADSEQQDEWSQLGLSASAAGLGEMQEVQSPASCVSTEAEREL